MGDRANGQTATRGAIYTRKSSEEGLEQDFNSLDAQREACEAFILSQKHEGWTALPDMYDDGGVSGPQFAGGADLRRWRRAHDAHARQQVGPKVPLLRQSLAHQAWTAQGLRCRAPRAGGRRRAPRRGADRLLPRG
jgi:hypothetical protein